MQFAARIFTIAKDPEHPEQFQDACHVDAAGGIAAVADGVASTLFSGQWAELLTQAIVADALDPADQEGFACWLKKRREAWSAQIDVSGLAWFQKAKLPLGAFCTLLWVRLLPEEESPPPTPPSQRLQAFALGDSCLLHVRGGEAIHTFPIQQSPQFDADPLAVGSLDLGRDQLLNFRCLEERCLLGDLLVLCTDAVAQWALRRCESGCPPAWDDYWHMTEQAWREEIVALREQGLMRYDDATLLLLRVVAQCAETCVDAQPTAPIEAAEPQPASAEELAPLAGQPSDTAAPDWAATLKSLSDRAYAGLDQVSQQMLRGLGRLKQKALEKYREQFRPDKKE